MNAINVIFPFKHNGIWMFTDKSVGLVNEPFVCGAGEIIDALASGIDDAGHGIQLFFSSTEFPGHQTVVEWVMEESGGNWYRFGEMEGWLCPALFKYFDSAPKLIFIRAEGMKK